MQEGERSGEIIIEEAQPGGGRFPQHKFYISSEPKNGDNTYILSVQQNSGEYRYVELTLTEDRLRMDRRVFIGEDRSDVVSKGVN
ncbi:hypothetical protein BAQ49_17145 [Bacillus proteolyticus]|uniref:Uncharacterized protein n=1 Tax=Bacillus proteolyticus TaxID=2026192 RepID=A0AA44KR31_9BACI|nr:hypothetical protein [Bacillus proteolyticus]OJE35561.1 hypothetical protein BAQ49_17145 [Bacillus proteolyticus]